MVELKFPNCIFNHEQSSNIRIVHVCNRTTFYILHQHIVRVKTKDRCRESRNLSHLTIDENDFIRQKTTKLQLIIINLN